MLRALSLSLLCHSLSVVAVPQRSRRQGGPNQIQSPPESSLSAPFTNSSTSRTSPPTSGSSSSPSLTAVQGTAVASSCPSSCSFDGPLITGYHWVPVVGNETITATIQVIVAPVTANVSGPFAVQQSSVTVVGDETLFNNLPPGVNPPTVGADGFALGQATTTGPDGSPTGTFIAYPTNLLDYPSSFVLSGALPANTGGGSTCGTKPETLPSHPAYTAASALPTDVDGSNFALVPAQFLDLDFLRAAFPDAAPFAECDAPVLPAPSAITGPVWVSVTQTITDTRQRGTGTNAPIIEQTVPPDSDSGGDFTPAFAHTEETVPTDDGGVTTAKPTKAQGGGGGGGRFTPNVAHTEETVPEGAIPTAAAQSNGDGRGAVQSAGSGNSGSTGNGGAGIGGAIASILSASPGSGAGASGPQPTAGTSSGSSAGTSSGSSSGGAGSSGSNADGSAGSSSVSSSGGSTGGSSSGGGSASGAGSSGGGSASGAGSSGAGSASGAGSSGAGSSSGTGSSGGSAGAASGGGSASGSTGGSSGGAAVPPAQSITVGSSTLSVTQTFVPVTSNVGGTPVTSDVPAVVIGGSTATPGQTLTINNTPVVFTPAPTAGSSSGGATSGSGAGSAGGSSGSGSGSGSSSGSGSAQGSGGELVIGGTSTVPLGPVATGSSSGALPAPITVGSQVIAPTSLPGSSGIGFVISGQTLAPSHPITLGTGASATTLSLTTDAAGNTVLVDQSPQGTTTQTIGGGEDDLPAITVGSQVIQPTELPNGQGEGFVISGQTLASNHPITLGSGTQTTVLSLTTDAAGDTILVEGTVTETLAGPKATGGTSSGGSSDGSPEQSNDAAGTITHGLDLRLSMAIAIGIAGMVSLL